MVKGCIECAKCTITTTFLQETMHSVYHVNARGCRVYRVYSFGGEFKKSTFLPVFFPAVYCVYRMYRVYRQNHFSPANYMLCVSCLPYIPQKFAFSILCPVHNRESFSVTLTLKLSRLCGKITPLGFSNALFLEVGCVVGGAF
jgi:hypothetical protein